jgi:uncharacterized protein YdeI (YjbR/CyaY-like superfamily)
MVDGPTFFATPADFRAWLKQHHRTSTELWVGFYKKGSGRPSLTWPESVDEALCVGWIDGVRKSLGPDSYMIRFTPRRANSIWSAVNIRRAEELTRLGRMRAAGRRAFESRNPRKSGVYSFEQRDDARLAPDAEARFRGNAPAWRYFDAQPAGYKKMAIWWVISARQEATRERRLATLIRDSEAGRRLGLLRR